MTPEQQRIAIAEACGVQTIYFRFWHLSHGGYKWWDGHETKGRAENLFHSFGDPEHPIEEYIETRWLPNYPACLNACHEMEKTLTYEECYEYHYQLDQIGVRDVENAGELSATEVEQFHFHSTAPQRCEAFLRVKCLWTGNNEPNVK